MEVQRAKGTKELMQEEKIKIDKIINVIKNTFERYGFSPFETPTLQRYDALASKYAGGSEILKETFKLKDQGMRDLALRYDLTVPMCIAIALNPSIKMPFKRYEIGKVYRDGPVEKSRVREFLQCDADVVGSRSLIADAECLNIFQDVFSELKIKAEIKVNSRKILNEIVRYSGIRETEKAILIIDKLDKFGIDQVKRELKQIGTDDQKIKKLVDILGIKGTNKQKIVSLAKIIGETEGIKEIEKLLDYCREIKVNVVFDISLARGLSYYTGPVFEVFAKDGKSAIAGGGRYDNMMGDILGRGDYPATGISFGIYRIAQLMKDEKNRTVSKVYVIPIKTEKESLQILGRLRDNGINSDMDTSGKNISKNLDYADKLGMPYVIFVGQQELKIKKVKLRNMKTGKEELLKIEEVIKKIK